MIHSKFGYFIYKILFIIKRIFVIDRDKLAQVGFHYLETVFNAKGVEIIEVKQDTD